MSDRLSDRRVLDHDRASLAACVADGEPAATRARASATRLDRWLHSRGLQSALVALLVGALVVWWVHDVGGPEGIRARYGLLAPLVWVPLQVAVHVTPIGDFVPWAVLNGSLFGLWGGALATWMAWLGSASIQYAIGRRTARDLDWEARTARLPAALRRLPLAHPAFLIVARWFPLMAGPINVAAGAARVPFERFVWCTAVGTSPQALVLAAIGAGLIGSI